jgi:hypothetical protein
MPPGYEVDTSGYKRDMNLGQRFCEDLIPIIINPVFRDLRYLQFCIGCAMYYRLKGEIPFPSGITWTGRNNNLIKALSEALGVAADEAAIRKIEGLLVEHIGKDRPPHWEFIKLLKAKAKNFRMVKEEKMILHRDLRAIGEAWDEFVIRPENIGSPWIKAMSTYQKEYRAIRGAEVGKREGSQLRQEWLAIKKRWIMNQRGSELRASSGTSSGREEGANQAADSGPSSERDVMVQNLVGSGTSSESEDGGKYRDGSDETGYGNVVPRIGCRSSRTEMFDLVREDGQHGTPTVT